MASVEPDNTQRIKSRRDIERSSFRYRNAGTASIPADISIRQNAMTSGGIPDSLMKIDDADVHSTANTTKYAPGFIYSTLKIK